MKGGSVVPTVVLVVVALAGIELLQAIVNPDLSTILLIAAGSTVVTGIVLWLFFRSVRRSEGRSPAPPTTEDARRLTAAEPLNATSVPCVLASAGCTTGWLDWIHGELWICSDGLLRRSVGIVKTLGHGSGRTVDPDERPQRAFTAAERYLIGNTGQANRWIPWTAIESAETRRGPMTDSLHYRLRDGSRGKLLWLRVDDAMGLIDATARSHLVDRYVSRHGDREAAP